MIEIVGLSRWYLWKWDMGVKLSWSCYSLAFAKLVYSPQFYTIWYLDRIVWNIELSVLYNLECWISSCVARYKLFTAGMCRSSSNMCMHWFEVYLKSQLGYIQLREALFISYCWRQHYLTSIMNFVDKTSTGGYKWLDVRSLACAFCLKFISYCWQQHYLTSIINL